MNRLTMRGPVCEYPRTLEISIGKTNVMINVSNDKTNENNCVVLSYDDAETVAQWLKSQLKWARIEENS